MNFGRWGGYSPTPVSSSLEFHTGAFGFLLDTIFSVPLVPQMEHGQIWSYRLTGPSLFSLFSPLYIWWCVIILLSYPGWRS